MTMQEMETLVVLLAKAGKAGFFDSFDLCYAISDCLKKHSAQSPTSFLGFYIGYLIREMTDLGYDLDDLPHIDNPIEIRKDRYQIDFDGLSIREYKK